MDKKQKEFDLWKKYKYDKDREAKRELVSSLTPLIRSQVNKYRNSNIPYASLELEGKKLTSKAIDDYDPDKGAQLNTYVTTHLQKLNRFVNSYTNVGSIPEPRALLIGRYQTIYSNLEDEKGREPTIAELADALQVSQAEISRLQDELRSDLHMELPSEDEGGFFAYIAPRTTDPRLEEAVDFVYFDSDATNKKILEHTLGYNNRAKWTNKDIKDKLNLTQTELKKRQKNLAKEIKELYDVSQM